MICELKEKINFSTIGASDDSQRKELICCGYSKRKRKSGQAVGYSVDARILGIFGAVGGDVSADSVSGADSRCFDAEDGGCTDSQSGNQNTDFVHSAVLSDSVGGNGADSRLPLRLGDCLPKVGIKDGDSRV